MKWTLKRFKKYVRILKMEIHLLTQDSTGKRYYAFFVLMVQ